jgi:hypothetical protein
MDPSTIALDAVDIKIRQEAWPGQPIDVGMDMFVRKAIAEPMGYVLDVQPGFHREFGWVVYLQHGKRRMPLKGQPFRRHMETVHWHALTHPMSSYPNPGVKKPFQAHGNRPEQLMAPLMDVLGYRSQLRSLQV